ncbi:MAG: glycosyltransferase family 2 protein [archaeon]
MKELKFSIIIALAPDRKISILDSLNKLDYPRSDYEIIVKKGLNPSVNRNEGIKESKGEILAFLDDDAIVHRDLLKNAEEFLKNNKDIGIVGGPQLTPKSDNFFAKISGYVLESKFGTYTMSNRYKIGKLNLDADETSITSANCFVRKTVFNKIKGFNPILFPGEDPEFFGRAKRSGIKIVYNPDLIIYHKRRSNLFDFCKQIYKYGKVRILKEKLNKNNIKLVFIIPTMFTIYMILSPLLVYFNIIFLLPIMLYFLISLVFSLYISMKKDILALPFLPFLFFLIHFSYGLGMLYSLIFKR